MIRRWIRRCLLAIFLAVPVQAVEVPQDVIADCLAAARNLKKLEEALPTIRISPVRIVVDHEGRVYLTETIQVHLELGYLSYDLDVQLHPQVQYQPKPDEKSCIVCNRYKAIGYVDLSASSEDLRFGGAFAYEPVVFHSVGLNLYVGSTLAGAALSLNLTKNFGAFGGVGWGYSDQTMHPVLGAFFSFN